MEINVFDERKTVEVSLARADRITLLCGRTSARFISGISSKGICHHAEQAALRLCSS